MAAMKFPVSAPFTFLLFLFFASFSVPAEAGDWPQWLGPDRNGAVPDEKVAAPGGEAEWPVVWKAEVGEGWATPVVAAGKVVLHTRAGEEERLECFAADTGKLLWRHAYPTSYRDNFGMNPGPRSTPTLAAGKVFAYGPSGELVCLDFASGKLVWKLNLAETFGSPKGFFGRCCSPLVADGRVLLDVGGPGAGVVAFEAETGKVSWKATEQGNDYSSPVVAKVGGAACALFFMRDGFLGLDAATGKPFFFERFRSPIDASVNAATPLLVGDSVFVSSCYDVGSALWKLEPGGPESSRVSPRLLWKKGGALDSHYATAVHHDGFLYGFHGRQERGPELRCVRLSDGQVQWTSGRMSAGNLILAGDKLLVLTEDGELLLAPADPKRFSVLFRQQVLGLETRAHFALAGGRLYARDKRRLVCLKVGAE